MSIKRVVPNMFLLRHTKGPLGFSRSPLSNRLIPIGASNRSTEGGKRHKWSERPTLNPIPLPNDEKPVRRVVDLNYNDLFDLFDVPLFYTYPTTPRWRETPANAHKRALRKKIRALQWRAKDFCAKKLAEERVRLLQERDQMERWKALRLQKRTAEWKEKMAERERIESVARADRARTEEYTQRAHAEKLTRERLATREWLQCIREERWKFDLAEMPRLLSLKNFKYETYEDKQWITGNN